MKISKVNKASSTKASANSSTSKSSPTSSASSVQSQTSTSSIQAKTVSSSSPTTNSQMTWVGDTGDKYHRQNCRTLKGNGHQITMQQALAEGRQACKVCKP